MARKEFTYRGKTLQELQSLSRKEFVDLLPSRSRRSILRGYNDAAKKAEQSILSGDNVKTHSREVVILPQFVGKVIKVHNGKEFVELRVQEEMIGHRLGEFSLTRKRVSHGSAGVGATKSSSALSVR